MKPLVVDVTETLRDLHGDGRNVLFEGAQGAMLDIDLGTYPFVTSSNTTVGGAAAGTGVGPASRRLRARHREGVYDARRCGPVPDRAARRHGPAPRQVGNEFGSTTGRPRRCGWFDAVLLRRAVFTNSVAGLCVTKLDVLDGLPEIKICVGYRLDGRVLDDAAAADRPFSVIASRVYETMPGWTTPDARRDVVRGAAARSQGLPAADRSSSPACRST